MTRLRNWSALLFACLGSLAIATVASAQAVQQPVVVQQPVFQSFSTNTTVTVPDGGSALLGGVDSARFGSSSRGVPMLSKVPGLNRLFTNRAIGSEVTSSRNYVRTRIIDLREMDEAILGSGAGNGALVPPNGLDAPGGVRHAAAHKGATENSARFLTRHVGRRNEAPAASRDTRPTKSATPVSKARTWLAKGDAALAEGKIELATKYYRRAELVADEIQPAPTSPRVAKRPSSAGEANRALVLGEER